MNDGCRTPRIALGAYVLGALDAADRGEVESHLAGCSDCRAELAGMASLPDALALVAAPAALALAAEGGEPVGSLVERTMARLGRARRRRRLALRLGTAAAAATIAMLAGAVAVLVASRPPAATPATAAALHLSGSDPSTGVTASVELYAEPWGAVTRLSVSGVSQGERCELVVVGRDGSQDVAGTWSVGYSGAVEVDGATSFTPDQVTSVSVLTTSGDTMIALQR